MERKKKVTVKIIANTALSYRINEEGEKEYPLYAQVTYDRKTTKFPVAGELWGTEDDVEKYFNSGFPQDYIKSIGEFERDRVSEFSVRGFADVYKVYASDFLMTTEFYLMEIVDEEIQKKITVAKYKELNPSGLFNYQRGLEILGMDVTPKIREALEVKDCLLRMRTDVMIYEWLIPKFRRGQLIQIIESQKDVASFTINLLDKVAFEMLEVKPFTV